MSNFSPWLVPFKGTQNNQGTFPCSTDIQLRRKPNSNEWPDSSYMRMCIYIHHILCRYSCISVYLYLYIYVLYSIYLYNKICRSILSQLVTPFSLSAKTNRHVHTSVLPQKTEKDLPHPSSHKIPRVELCCKIPRVGFLFSRFGVFVCVVQGGRRGKKNA